tara:strand:- start:21601 stop:23199 length:1599 start_codon:yes stop_codon:yes gene_type:complete
MAYVKPGVEVTQVQESSTPILTAPTLTATVVGCPYYWHDVDSDEAVVATTYSGVSQDVLLSSLNATYNAIDADDVDLVVVDLLATAGDAAGEIKHLVKGTDFTVTHADNKITVNAGISIGTAAVTKGEIRVGFRCHKTDSENIFHTFDSLQAIRDELGKVVTWNPLAYATHLCQVNSNSVVSAYGATNVDDAGTLEQLGLQETYALAFIDDDVSAATIGNHCTTYSSATNKKERIAFINKKIAWSGSDWSSSSTDRANTAAAIRDGNSGLANKRLFTIHPDVAYVQETRHISTTKPSFVTASFATESSVNFTTNNALCRLAVSTTANGVKYQAGTLIDDTVWANLNAQGFHSITVKAPVPGSYYCAATAGLLIAQTPEQPMTNLPVGGLDETWGSQDFFTEANLNTMAQGGTYIMTQDTKTGPIYSRHQTSTDISSVAKRELNITKSLDFAAKFIRSGLKPYIGRNVISPAFLKLLESVLVSQGLFLVRDGVLNDFKVASVKQDASSPDTINVEVNVLVKYPVNYIKIKLVF